nr:retrovirus-related Pol polyprotein from transposon TNT 1-94 [Tanacetum cinerariifolium]
LIGATPAGTLDSLISLFDLTLNMADRTLDKSLPKKTRPTSVKVSPGFVIKRKTKNKSPLVSESYINKKDDSSTEQLLLTLIEEVKGLKKQIETPSGTFASNSQSSSSKSNKQKTDHLEKFDEKADDGFFLGYSPLDKAFRVFNIKRQEMKETVHVTFSENDEAISQSSTEGDAINFNENRSFPDDEFLKPRSKDYGSPREPPEFTNADDHPAFSEHDHFESNRWSREKHIELVNIIGKPLDDIITKSRVRDSEAALAHKCLYVNFLSKMDPKKLIETLVEEGWIIAMQEELNQFERNKDKALYGLKQAPQSMLADLISNSPHVSVLGLWYLKGSGFDLKSYSDSDYAGCNLDKKSTSGGCQILGGKLVRWNAKKQSSMTMSSAKAEQPSTTYVKYLKDIWYTAKVDEATQTITFSLSSVEKPLSFTQDTFISTICLIVCTNAVPLPPKETVRVGLATLAKLFQEPEQSLILSFEKVNADDRADKSSSGTTVQPLTQPKAPTDLKLKKKKIPPSSKPKSSHKVRAILPKKQVVDTHPAEETVATTDAT